MNSEQNENKNGVFMALKSSLFFLAFSFLKKQTNGTKTVPGTRQTGSSGDIIQACSFTTFN